MAEAASELALFFAGAPEDDVTAALRGVEANLAAQWAEAFGADTAAVIAQRFVAAVARRRREIDVEAIAPPSVSN